MELPAYIIFQSEFSTKTQFKLHLGDLCMYVGLLTSCFLGKEPALLPKRAAEIKPNMYRCM